MKRVLGDLTQDILRVPLIFYLAAFFLLGVKCGYLFIPLKVIVVVLLFFIAGLTVLVAVRYRPSGGRPSQCIVDAKQGRADLRAADNLWSWLKFVFLFVLFFALGATRSSYDVYNKLSDQEYVSKVDNALVVRCRIQDIVSVKRLKGRAARYRITVKYPRVLDGDRELSLPLTVNWYGDYDRSVTRVPSSGEEWVFKGRIYRSRRRADKSSFVLNSGEDSSQLVKRSDPFSWEQRLAGFRSDAARRISYGIAEKEYVVEINQAILLGLKENIPRSMKRVFACSGTIHVFAISGLHIALLASVMVFIVSTCGVPRYRWFFILAPLLIAYTLATGMRPSAVRATLMALIFFAAPLFGRRFNALSALATAALIVHLFSPAYISDIGAILSFSVMLGLVVLYKPLCYLLELLFKVDKLQQNAELLAASDELKLAERMNNRIQLISFISGLCAVTVSAWLASMPLCAYYFGRITPGGLIANLVISPCALMLVIAGVLGFVSSFISTALAVLFNNAAGFFSLIMMKTAGFISSCPASNFEVSSFPVWLVWCWFGMLFLSSWLLRRWIARRDDGLEWIER